MIKAILFFLVCFQSVFAFAQVDDNADRLLYKTNRVKSVKIYESWRNNGKPCKKEKLIFNTSYDTCGLETESFYYDSFWLGEFHWQYKYDSLENVRESISFINDKPFSTYYTYTYDRNGRVLEKNKREEKWLFTYDSAGKLITQQWILHTGYPQDFLLDSFQYNPQGQLIKMTRYHDGTLLYFYNTYSYDDAGNQIIHARFQNGEMTDTWYYHYDGNHHKTGTDHFGSQMEKTSLVPAVEYNANGLILSRINDKKYWRYVYEYY